MTVTAAMVPVEDVHVGDVVRTMPQGHGHRVESITPQRRRNDGRLSNYRIALDGGRLMWVLPGRPVIVEK